MEKIKFLVHQSINMIMKIYKLLLVIFFFLLTSYNAIAEEKIEHKIAVLVNDEVITSYDIIQRLKLAAIIQGINLNAQNSQLMVNNVADELIHEKVKLSKINEYQIKVEDNEYKEFEINFFERNKINQDEVLNLLEENNINYQELKKYLMGELAWNKLINGLFYRLTSISDLEVRELVNKNPTLSNEQAENLVIQRQLDLQSSKLLRDMMNEATIEYK
jgi:parvulin-like peptidyl-prolyl isomerase